MAGAYVSDFVPAKQRTKYLSYLNTASGLGFVVGPAVGGFMASSSLSFGLISIIAFSITALIVLLGVCFMQESTLSKKNPQLQPSEDIQSDPKLPLPKSTFLDKLKGWLKRFSVLQDSYLARLFVAKFIAEYSLMCHEVTYTLVLQEMQIDQAYLGIIWAAYGTIDFFGL